MKKILAVITNSALYADTFTPTGLWLSELTHFIAVVAAESYTVDFASPNGGACPIDPESLNPFMLDRPTQKHYKDPVFMKRLQETLPLSKVKMDTYQVIYLTGGHGTLYDFPDNETLQKLILECYQNQKIVAAVCHGVCGLLNVRLPNNGALISKRKITGYSWFEEVLARRNTKVPFNLEDELRKRGCFYSKALLPLMPFVKEDEGLITGQNPFSTKKLARAVLKQLKSKPGHV